MTTPYQELTQRFGVSLTIKDVKRLLPHLSNWPKLSNVLMLGLPNEDLKKMVLIELNGKQRREILSRLCARLKKQELKQLRELVFACLR